MIQKFGVLFLALICSPVVAQDTSWMPPLNPGETLVAINGVPVSQHSTSIRKGPVRQALSHLGNAARYVVNRDQRAYQHALREAQILAQRGTAGHPLGCAPGTSMSGTGYSWDGRPNHCYLGELPSSRLVARAVVRGRNGAYFWSAHYR